MKEHGDQQDDEKRGQRRTHSGADGSSHSSQLIAYEDADVNGEHARTALCDGDEVEKLVFVNPLMPVNHFCFNDWYHGITAAKGKRSYLDKCLKECNPSLVVLRCLYRVGNFDMIAHAL